MADIQQKPNGQKLTQEQQDKAVEYIAFGSKNVVRLTVAMVRNYLCRKSKMGHLPSDADCLRFIKRCQSQQLDPWLDECYLVGYDRWTKDRQCVGADFQMIINYSVYFKRAELNPDFDGFQSGVTVTVAHEMIEREGDLVLPNEVLVGGWCRIYRKNIKYPVFKRASLATNAKNTDFWSKDPAMMIVKTAEADCFRSAFPSTVGHMYMEQEIESWQHDQHEVEGAKIEGPPAPAIASPNFGRTDERVLADRYRTSLRDEYGLGDPPEAKPAPTAPAPAKTAPAPKAKVKKVVVTRPIEETPPSLDLDSEADREVQRGQQQGPPEVEVEATPVVPEGPKLDPNGPHGMLQKKLDDHGFDFNTLVGWATRTGNYPDADTHSTLGEVPRGIVERWLRAWMGLKVGLEDYKRGAYDQ